MQIALDGPAGAGKSTIALALSEKLQFLYLDTGAMYRAFGLFTLKMETDVENEEAVCALLPLFKLSIVYENRVQRMILNGEEVTSLIRTQQVGQAASAVSRYAKVRNFMVSLQREIAGSQNVIMDGRDIGTRVLPNAQLKVFLTASAQERAARRVKQLEEKGIQANFEEVKKEIEQRDLQDSTRTVDPLRQAEDAVLLDSSAMTAEEVVQAILRLAEHVQK